MGAMDAESPRLRLSIFGVVILALFGALFARLWYLQVMDNTEYQEVSQSNSVRVLTTEAPRGRILDSQGRVVVDNRTSLVVTVDKTRLIDLDADERGQLTLDLASELTAFGVPTKVAAIERRLDDPQFSPLQPVPIAIDVPEELGVVLAERSDDFPGVAVRRESVRAYPHGTVAAHLVGYVGPMPQDTYEALDSNPVQKVKPYQPDSDVGRTGVEAVYEADLRGTPGTESVEIDRLGRIVRTVSVTPPVPGNDLQLAIDLDVQRNAEEQLAAQLDSLRGQYTRDGKLIKAPAGSVVVLSPRDGSVVALASYPTYDPAEFVNGISTVRYEKLTGGDATQNPLTNRAISGLYAPGSTFKLITAHAGLQSGMITAASTRNDPGYYVIEGCRGACERQNAGREAYGGVDLARSLTVSSDVYYYWLADRMFRERSTYGDPIQASARQFGFDERTGIALPGESGGVIPDPEWKKELFDLLPPEQQANGDPTWYAGDNLNLGIGQGDVLATPLQVAHSYAIFANRGTVYEPRIAIRVLTAGGDPADPSSVERSIDPVVTRTFDLPPSIADPIERGLAGVTIDRRGTATGVFEGWNSDAWPLASKTGTAEVNGKADSSLYVAYGPIGDPQYVVFAILEESGFGSQAAAPVVRRVLEPLAGQVPVSDDDLAAASTGAG